MFTIITSPVTTPVGLLIVRVVPLVVAVVAVPRCTISGSTQFILVLFEDVVKLKGLEIAAGKIESRKKTRVDSRRTLIIDEEINRIKDQFTQVKIE
jgi:hypothetical protein